MSRASPSPGLDDSAGDGRTARSRATRTRIARTAAHLFVESGYATTSIRTIAAQAGVSVQTVYYTFKTKPAILAAALDLTIAGDDQPVDPLGRPWLRHALAMAEPAEQVRRHVAGVGQILRRAAPLLQVVRGAAAVDPDLAHIWRTNIEQRRTVQRVLIEALATKTPLRPGLDVDTATDIALMLLSPETYTLLTVERNWTPHQWRCWVRQALLEQVVATAPTPGEAC
ncbi:TetR/AcrR family transcriptional regulator [Salinactinospora qingdaonensis]|uniref:TetR/AcrR family transcriptional regulator n=1 Tax=Salinactinospora qingdaonensis TaxID=702744 RepID=A0ABP7G2T4_9ACTN